MKTPETLSGSEPETVSSTSGSTTSTKPVRIDEQGRLIFPVGREVIRIESDLIIESAQANIFNYMYFHAMPRLPHDWDWHYKVTEKTTYTGTFAKRVSKYLAKEHGYKIADLDLNCIADIAVRGVPAPNDYDIEFVQKFDWEDGDFGDEGSCFWTYNADARVWMEEAGFYAILLRATRDEEHYGRYGDMERRQKGHGYARAWLCPVLDGKGVIVFNGYGFADNPTREISTILTAYFGDVAMQYIGLENHGKSDGTLYLNSGGYLIGLKDSIAGFTRHYDFELGPEYEYCTGCDEYVESLPYEVEGEHVCESCFENANLCDACNNYFWETEEVTTHNGYRRISNHYCQSCYEERYTACDSCGNREEKDAAHAIDGEVLCDSCYEERYVECYRCGDPVDQYDAKTDKYDDHYCSFCYTHYVPECNKSKNKEKCYA